MKTLVSAAEPPERPAWVSLNTAATTVPTSSAYVIVDTVGTLRAPAASFWTTLNTAAASGWWSQ